MKETGYTIASNFFIIYFVTLVVFSLTFTKILNTKTNTSVDIDAFAKTFSNTDSSVRNGISGSNSEAANGTIDNPKTYGHQLAVSRTNTNNNINNNYADKFVIINFDDSHQSDYTYAKPILDKYGFKATFFEVCNWVEAGYHDKDISVTWQQIAALQQDGMDIESHTMTHPNLNDLSSQADLNYEIGQSKQCLENHGFNPTIFAYPNGKGSDNPKVVNTVAKYYDLARTDTKSALTFLHCDGNNDEQTDCKIYFGDGTLTPSNRYSINSWAHKHIDEGCSTSGIDNVYIGSCTMFRYKYDNAQMFQKFVSAVNNQSNYNIDGIVRAIPIIVYHTLVNYSDLSESNRPIDTTINLFDTEMKYLHDNGFKVITIADLAYDENNRSLHIKNT